VEVSAWVRGGDNPAIDKNYFFLSLDGIQCNDESTLDVDGWVQVRCAPVSLSAGEHEFSIRVFSFDSINGERFFRIDDVIARPIA
jgi:hypothetical protein